MQGVWVCLGGGYFERGRGEDGWVCSGREYSRSHLTPPVMTPTGSHQNIYGWQAAGTHPTEMHSCLDYDFERMAIAINYFC